MKTINDLKNMIENNVDAYRAEYRRIRDAKNMIEEIQKNDYFDGKTPVESIEHMVAELGFDTVQMIVASLVNYHAWDGRIGTNTKEWAAGIESAYDKEAAGKLCIYTNKIHMVHLEQLAWALMKYQPAEPATPATMMQTLLTVGLFDKDTCKQEISTPDARAMLDEILLNRYGLYAYTMLDCFGCYTMRAGQIVHEPSIRIEIVTESPIANLQGMICDIKAALNQESIMCEVTQKQIAFI